MKRLLATIAAASLLAGTFFLGAAPASAAIGMAMVGEKCYVNGKPIDCGNSDTEGCIECNAQPPIPPVLPPSVTPPHAYVNPTPVAPMAPKNVVPIPPQAPSYGYGGGVAQAPQAVPAQPVVPAVPVQPAPDPDAQAKADHEAAAANAKAEQEAATKAKADHDAAAAAVKTAVTAKVDQLLIGAQVQDVVEQALSGE